MSTDKKILCDMLDHAGIEYQENNNITSHNIFIGNIKVCFGATDLLKDISDAPDPAYYSGKGGLSDDDIDDIATLAARITDICEDN